jgi:hypothetical protein
MASGTRVASKGVRTSYGKIATLPGLSPRPRLGLTGLLWPDGATTAALMRTLASLLNLGAGAVRAARGRRSTSGRRMPWRDHKPATQVIAAATGTHGTLPHHEANVAPKIHRCPQNDSGAENGGTEVVNWWWRSLEAVHSWH